MDRAQQGALARAVGADESNPVAALHSQVDGVQRQLGAEAHRGGLKLDQGSHAPPSKPTPARRRASSSRAAGR